MKNLALKLRVGFFPLLKYSIASLFCYPIVYYFFFIYLKAGSLKTDIIQFWIPIIIAGILVMLLIRKRIHAFKLDKDEGRIRGLYYLVATAVICAPSIIAVHYLESATGKLTKLSSIGDIREHAESKYYLPQAYVIQKSFPGVKYTSNYSGKTNSTLNYEMYISVPISAHVFDTQAYAFMAIKFHSSLSARSSKEERSKEWKDFVERSLPAFDRYNFNFDYLENHSHTTDKEHFIDAARTSDMYVSSGGHQQLYILQAIKEPFNQRNGNKLPWTFGSLIIGWALWFIMIAIPGLHLTKARKLLKHQSNVIEETKNLMTGLKPHKGTYTSAFLICCNLIVFLLMVLSGTDVLNMPAESLIKWGALYKPLFSNGEYYRLFTSTFLHAGILHLLMNMFSLYIAGMFCEPIIGTKKLLISYFFSGIAASLCTVVFSDHILSVGASGAIFGLYGLILSFVVFKVFDREAKKLILIILACTAGYSLIMGLLMPAVNNVAHFSGLIAGFIVGAIMGPSVKQKAED